MLTRCPCGDERRRRVADLIKRPARCKSCTAKALDSIQRAAKVRAAMGYRSDGDRRVARVLSGAKKRCQTTSAVGYQNYGGRGIEFRFDSIRDGVNYIREHLPPRPEGHTLDRKDNDGHYERGNLRWADGLTQRLNQRPHRRDNVRVTRLHALLPDMSRESVRRMVTVKGYSDEQILNRKKGSHAA